MLTFSDINVVSVMQHSLKYWLF